jgi:hypothetical protein
VVRKRTLRKTHAVHSVPALDAERECSLGGAEHVVVADRAVVVLAREPLLGSRRLGGGRRRALRLAGGAGIGFTDARVG